MTASQTGDFKQALSLSVLWETGDDIRALCFVASTLNNRGEVVRKKGHFMCVARLTHVLIVRLFRNKSRTPELHFNITPP